MKAGVVDVHISVVNTNNRDLLERCLSSLPDACADVAWRATVVDNASSDGSAELVAEQFPWALLMRNSEREGFSANHNKVIVPVVRDRTARYVLILNEDTELAPRCIARLVECADRDSRVGAVGPRIQGPHGEYEQSFFPFPSLASEVQSTLLPGSRRRSGSPRTGWLNGSCILTSVDALTEIGSLDERFFIFFEDTDLGRRLADAGRPSVLCEEAAIIHFGHRTVSKQPGARMEQQMLRSRYLYFLKHHGRPTAEIVSTFVRTALALRASKAAVAGLVGKDADERQLGRLLLQLARYSPSRPLEHELVSRGVPT